jgi:hypothetical protein
LSVLLSDTFLPQWMPRTVPHLCRLSAACYPAAVNIDPPTGYISSADACRRLSISDRTLRRRVQAGSIAGEYIARPQGTILYVKLPEAVAAEQAATGGDSAFDQRETPDGQHAAPVAPTAPLEAYMALVADIRTLERENGALRAERDAAMRAADEAAARGTELQKTLDQERARSWWRRLIGYN